jgi:hypothetical protein
MPRLAPCLLLLAALPLSSCAPIFNSLTAGLTLHPNPTAPAVVAAADTLSGTYLGTGKLGFLNTRYRLVLNVNARANRADGVLTNLSNDKAYALTAKYVPVTTDGGSLDAEIFEGGRKAGTLTARVSGGELRGTLATPAFAYDLSLQRQP